MPAEDSLRLRPSDARRLRAQIQGTLVLGHVDRPGLAEALGISGRFKPDSIHDHGNLMDSLASRRSFGIRALIEDTNDWSQGGHLRGRRVLRRRVRWVWGLR